MFNQKLGQEFPAYSYVTMHLIIGNAADCIFTLLKQQPNGAQQLAVLSAISISSTACVIQNLWAVTTLIEATSWNCFVALSL